LISRAFGARARDKARARGRNVEASDAVRGARARHARVFDRESDRSSSMARAGEGRRFQIPLRAISHSLRVCRAFERAIARIKRSSARDEESARRREEVARGRETRGRETHREGFAADVCDLEY